MMYVGIGVRVAGDTIVVFLIKMMTNLERGSDNNEEIKFMFPFNQ